MATPQLLIVSSSYSDTDRARLEAAAPSLSVGETTEIAALSEAQRAGITVAAFKGHKPFGTDVMALLPNLKLIANFGVGYDSIDAAGAAKLGIKVTNTPDVLNDDVADLAVAMLLACCREVVKADAWVRSGDWGRKGDMPLNRKMSGGKLGIVGLGRIGRDIAERFAAFKMDIHYHSRSEKQTPGWTYHADVVDLAREVDFLVVALVGGAATKGYVSREVIQALGPRGIIINISRGTTIDEAAMLDALESGAIAGAGLDVFLNEPRVDPRFFALPNVVLQPHQGSATVETRRDMALLQLENIKMQLAGKPLVTPVN
ncbi:MAG: 2-hydroxyacid dehydrogenase [Roseivivax sp.]|nr:2-hydroxyacid dehydrogenase [Roseivivax sp.]